MQLLGTCLLSFIAWIALTYLVRSLTTHKHATTRARAEALLIGTRSVVDYLADFLKWMAVTYGVLFLVVYLANGVSEGFLSSVQAGATAWYERVVTWSAIWVRISGIFLGLAIVWVLSRHFRHNLVKIGPIGSLVRAGSGLFSKGTLAVIKRVSRVLSIVALIMLFVSHVGVSSAGPPSRRSNTTARVEHMRVFQKRQNAEKSYQHPIAPDETLTPDTRSPSTDGAEEAKVHQERLRVEESYKKLVAADLDFSTALSASQSSVIHELAAIFTRGLLNIGGLNEPRFQARIRNPLAWDVSPNLIHNSDLSGGGSLRTRTTSAVRRNRTSAVERYVEDQLDVEASNHPTTRKALMDLGPRLIAGFKQELTGQDLVDPVADLAISSILEHAGSRTKSDLLPGGGELSKDAAKDFVDYEIAKLHRFLAEVVARKRPTEILHDLTVEGTRHPLISRGEIDLLSSAIDLPYRIDRLYGAAKDLRWRETPETRFERWYRREPPHFIRPRPPIRIP